MGVISETYRGSTIRWPNGRVENIGKTPILDISGEAGNKVIKNLGRVLAAGPTDRDFARDQIGKLPDSRMRDQMAEGFAQVAAKIDMGLFNKGRKPTLLETLKLQLLSWKIKNQLTKPIPKAR